MLERTARMAAFPPNARTMTKFCPSFFSFFFSKDAIAFSENDSIVFSKLDEHWRPDMADATPTRTAPYITYSLFDNFISGLSEFTVPPQIDTSLLRNMSGSNQSG